MDLGAHAVFIWLCYAAAALIIAGTILWLWLDGLRLGREIDLIEAQAARRHTTRQS